MEEGMNPKMQGRISRENLRQTLFSLNASLGAARGVGAHGAPLTDVQIDILSDHAAFDEDGTLDYQAFLDAFQVVDTGAPSDDDASPSSNGNGGNGASATGLVAAPGGVSFGTFGGLAA